jgi:hypothetical protein
VITAALILLNKLWDRKGPRVVFVGWYRRQNLRRRWCVRRLLRSSLGINTHEGREGCKMGQRKKLIFSVFPIYGTSGVWTDPQSCSELKQEVLASIHPHWSVIEYEVSLKRDVILKKAALLSHENLQKGLRWGSKSFIPPERLRGASVSTTELLSPNQTFCVGYPIPLWTATFLSGCNSKKSI